MSAGPNRSDQLRLEGVLELLSRPQRGLLILHCYAPAGITAAQLCRALHSLLRELSGEDLRLEALQPPPALCLYPSDLQQQATRLLSPQGQRGPQALHFGFAAASGGLSALLAVLVNLATAAPQQGTLTATLLVLAVGAGIAVALMLLLLEYLVDRQRREAPARALLKLVCSRPGSLMLLDMTAPGAHLTAEEVSSPGARLLDAASAGHFTGSAPVLLACHSDVHSAAAAAQLQAERLTAQGGDCRLYAVLPAFSPTSGSAALQSCPATRAAFPLRSLQRGFLQELAELLRRHEAEELLHFPLLAEHDSHFHEEVLQYLHFESAAQLAGLMGDGEVRVEIEDLLIDLLKRRLLEASDDIRHLANALHPAGYNRGYRLEDGQWVGRQIELLEQLGTACERSSLLPFSLFALTLFFEAVWWYGEWHLNPQLKKYNNSKVAICPEIYRIYADCLSRQGLSAEAEAADGEQRTDTLSFFVLAGRLMQLFVEAQPASPGLLPISGTESNFDYDWQPLPPLLERMLQWLEDQNCYTQLCTAHWAHGAGGSGILGNMRLLSLLNDRLADAHEALMLRAIQGSDPAAATAHAQAALEHFGRTRSLYAAERELQLSELQDSCPFAYCAWSWYESAELRYRQLDAGGSLGRAVEAAAARQLRALSDDISAAFVELQHFHACEAHFTSFEWELMSNLQLLRAELAREEQPLAAARCFCDALLAAVLLHFTASDADGYSVHVHRECLEHFAGFVADCIAAQRQDCLALIRDYWRQVVESSRTVGLPQFEPRQFGSADSGELSLLLPSLPNLETREQLEGAGDKFTELCEALYPLLFAMLASDPLPAAYNPSRPPPGLEDTR